MSVRDDLAPDLIRAHIEAQTCPWCGAGPFKVLAQHTNLSHGVDRKRLRHLAGLRRRDRMSSPEHVSMRRDRLIERPDYRGGAWHEEGWRESANVGAQQIGANRQGELSSERTRAMVDEFLGGDRTWLDLSRIADAHGITRKTMAAHLRSAGAPVPDGRTVSQFRGKASGRVYSTKPKVPCTDPECDRDAISKGMCRKHYQKSRRNG